MPDERRPAPGEGQAFGNDALSGKPERPEGNQAQSRPQAAIRAVTVYRLKLKAAGFHPLPINGKRPAIEKWETKTDASTGEIELWEKLFPYAPSTGILTQRTPTIDIDILDPFAADTIEHLAGDHFGERGVFLTRFGRPPKRAIPLRTATPFKKQTLLLTAPNGAEHKIVGLCAGQQVVIDGIHPTRDVHIHGTAARLVMCRGVNCQPSPKTKCACFSPMHSKCWRAITRGSASQSQNRLAKRNGQRSGAMS